MDADVRDQRVRGIATNNELIVDVLFGMQQVMAMPLGATRGWLLCSGIGKVQGWAPAVVNSCDYSN